MICRFYEPVEASTVVTVEHGFSDEVGHILQRENIIYCPIPAEVKVRLTFCGQSFISIFSIYLFI